MADPTDLDVVSRLTVGFGIAIVTSSESKIAMNIGRCRKLQELFIVHAVLLPLRHILPAVRAMHSVQKQSVETEGTIHCPVRGQGPDASPIFLGIPAVTIAKVPHHLLSRPWVVRLNAGKRHASYIAIELPLAQRDAARM